MDDLLPLTIYIVSQAEVNNLAAHFNMIDDFIKINEQLGTKRSGGVTYESEKRMLTNFNSGLIYISLEWEPPAPPDLTNNTMDEGLLEEEDE
mmetsp:Transcript_15575/g.23894  ORF Transcript_15575/g.23894 Transcript_15575/m.23894 type:complete len:92 (+) Transcript_15575:1308-1583(+)